MTSFSNFNATGPKGRSNSAQFPPNIASAVLERHNLARRATPDSDALVSSDDDHEVNPRMSQSAHVGPQTQGLARPGRRASWLSEVSSSQAARKKSTSGTSKPNSTGVPSQPSTPQTENGPSSSSTYFANPFSTSNRPLNRPSALSSSIAAPSPTSAAFDDMRSPTSQYNPPPSAGLGVPIPTEPVRKAVRSQSYSAGQLEEMNLENLSLYGNDRYQRAGPLHRASRPNLGDRPFLTSLQEDEDAESPVGVSYVQKPLMSAKMRSTEFGGFSGLRRSSTTPITHTFDSALDPYDDDQDTFPQTTQQKPLQNSLLPSNFGRPMYSSSLGFDTSDDMPQSRRHSFAALSMPRTRNGSMPAQRSELASFPMKPEAYGQAAMPGNQSLHRDMTTPEREFATSFAARQHYPQEGEYVQHEQSNDKVFAASYFSGAAAQVRHLHEQSDDDPSGNFSVPNVYSRPGRILYIVSFKCARADIYYIDDNMGLELTPGDTVIVDGDRGTDLGTVEHCNINMPEAKRLKNEYAKKHFKNLMMFSRLFPHMAALAGNDELVDKSFSMEAGSPSGGVALPGPLEQEPRPKAIRRIATPDELHLLREKEGNEAKAKRLCQNKVSEHGLRMEVLDAEFQHDYKKLTFFYYAEEYINFNQLVTELFKVYKTRIWMSAINAASHSLMNQNNPMRSGPSRGSPHVAHAAVQHQPRPAANFPTAPYGHPSQSPFTPNPATGRWVPPTQPYAQVPFGYNPVPAAGPFNAGGGYGGVAGFGASRGR